MKIKLPPPLDMLTIMVALVWMGLLLRYFVSNTLDRELFGTISGLLGTMIGYQVSARKKDSPDGAPLSLEKKKPPVTEPITPPAPPIITDTTGEKL
jgi:hypothetical protein